MAEQLPQFKDENPILNTQTINSRESGYSALSQVFGETAQKASNIANDLLDEQSNAVAVQSQNMLSDITTQAHIQMINNPDMAEQIANDSKYTIKSIIDSSFVNDKDRNNLSKLSNTYTNQIGLTAAETAHRQMLTNATVNFYKSYPEAIKSINQLTYMGDHAGAAQRQDDLSKNIESLARIGAITPDKYAILQAALKQTIDRAQMNFEMAQSGNATAKDYHEANGSIVGNISTNIAGLPADETSSQIAGHASSEISKEKALSDIYTYGYLTNPNESENLSGKEFESLHETWLGANAANAAIASNGNQQALKYNYDQLQEKAKTSGLSLREEGYMKRIGSYYNQLNNDFFGTMQNSVLGARIHEQAINSSVAIQNSPDLSNEEKAYRIKQNDDWEKTQQISTFIAQGGNPNFVKMDAATMQLPKAAFAINGNPDLLIKTIRSTSSYLHPYIADSMPEANQKAVVSIVANAGDQIQQGVAEDMVRANQPRQFKILSDTEGSQKIKSGIDKTLIVDNNVASMLNYLNLMPPTLTGEKSGVSDPVGAINALTNTVLYKAEQSADFSVNNLSNYVAPLKSAVAQAYNIYTDTNVVFNRSTLNSPDGDLRALGNYAKDRVYKSLRGTMDETRFADYVDRQPVMIVNTPNNQIVAIDAVTHQVIVDKDNHPIFDVPYSPSLIGAAKHYQSQYDVNKFKNLRENNKEFRFEGLL